jgi:uncharacterized protein YecE (DUF72 family)
MLLLQLPPDLPYMPERLDSALRAFMPASLVAVEFRDERWLTDEVFSLLKSRGANFCNPDYPQHPLSEIVTASNGYLRLHGRRAWYTDDYTYDELSSIADSADKLQRQGAEEVYIFFNNDYAAHAPYNASALSQRLCMVNPASVHANG